MLRSAPADKTCCKYCRIWSCLPHTLCIDDAITDAPLSRVDGSTDSRHCTASRARLQLVSHSSLCSNSPQEDRTLKELVGRHSTRWKTVALFMATKTDSQVLGATRFGPGSDQPIDCQDTVQHVGQLQVRRGGQQSPAASHICLSRSEPMTGFPIILCIILFRQRLPNRPLLR